MKFFHKKINNSKLQKIDFYGDDLIVYQLLYGFIRHIKPSEQIFIGMDRFCGNDKIKLSFDEIINMIFLKKELPLFPIDVHISKSKKISGLLYGTYVYPNQISVGDLKCLIENFSEITIILCSNSFEEIKSRYTDHSLDKLVNSTLSIVYIIAIHENCITLYYDKENISYEEIQSYFSV